jgi:hypothetical protein
VNICILKSSFPLCFAICAIVFEMKLISVSDPNVWRSVEESGIRFWGCFGFKPEIMRRDKGQDQSWKGRLQSEKWKANINKTTSDLRDGLTMSSDPCPHGRRSNFFPPKNWMRSYDISNISSLQNPHWKGPFVRPYASILAPLFSCPDPFCGAGHFATHGLLAANTFVVG